MKTFPILTLFVTALAATGLWLIGPSSELFSIAKLLAQDADQKTDQPGETGENAPADSKQEPPDTTVKSAPADTESRAAAADVMKKARDALLSFRSIKADIREAIVIGGRRLEVTGSYLQGANLKLRLEFNVSLGNQDGALAGSVLQVCDGRTLWTVQTIGSSEEEKPLVTRRDVKEILLAVEASDSVPENVLIAELGLGGLPSLLASLERSMVFQAVKQETIQDKTLTVVEGTWIDTLRERFLSIPGADKKKQKENTDRLPDHIPDSVKIYLDPENSFFPRRIVYLKRPPGKDFAQPMVTIAFAEIVLNGPVDEEAFSYIPPEGVPQENITKYYTDRLKPRAETTPVTPNTPVIE